MDIQNSIILQLTYIIKEVCLLKHFSISTC